MSFVKNIQKLFFKYLIWLILIVSGGILTYMLIDLSKTIQSLAKDAIEQTTERTERELDNFFHPVINSLMIAKEWGINSKYQNLDPEVLNSKFIPILSSFEQVSSMLIANNSGDEYMLLEMGDKNWINRRTIQENDEKKVLKYVWDYKKENALITREDWIEKKDYDPRLRPWYQAAIENKHIKAPAWTDPYTFFTTKDPGITTSIKWAISDTTDYVIAFDLMLTDISKYTTSLHPSETGKVFIITSDRKIIGLPAHNKYAKVDSIKANVLKPANQIGDNEIIKALEHINTETKYQSFHYKCKNKKWWGKLQKYHLSPETYLIIGVVVPEEDFLSKIKQTRNTIIIGFVLVIVLTLFIVYSFLQQRKANILLAQRNEEIMQQKEEIITQNEHITQQKEEIEAQRDQLEIQNEDLFQAKEEIEAQRDEIESQRDEVLKQKDYIVHQNKEITDSIKYAKRIQAAILPIEEFRYKLLPEHFILFKPLNIVSGDFYWMTHLEGRIIIAVADCTGHGVPGAFMSMLGAAFLNEIVNKEYITHTGVILRRLRKQIVKALQQTGSEGEQKDGMDITLCSIDMEKLEIQFSGANNPLYLIRNRTIDPPAISEDNYKTLESEDQILYEIKADKMPIAIYEKMDRFTTQEFNLEKGDVLYLFSDGFPDQFGGPRGKKFMYKTFKKLLLSIQEKNMSEQQVILDHTIEEWKAYIDPVSGLAHEQIDDICIIGFSIK